MKTVKSYFCKSRIFQGFTLIELLLVMTVVGVLTTFAAGTYRDYATTQRVSVAADEVASLMNVAKTRAISQVKPAACGGSELDGYRVVTCPAGAADNQSYQLEAFCGGIGRKIGNTYKLAQNTTFGCSAAQTILFRTLSGASVASGNVTLSSSGKMKTISVDKSGLITLSGLESTVPVPGAPTLNFSANTLSVGWGGSVTLSWTTTGADNCTASSTPANVWAGTKVPNNTGGEVVGSLTAMTTFTLFCSGAGGQTTPQNKTVTVGAPTSPAISSFTAEDPVLPPTNTGTVLHWTTTGSITSCTASGGSGAWTGEQTFPTGDFDTGALAVTTMYTLTCTGPLGSAVSSVTVTVSSAAPTPTPTPKTVLVDSTSTSGPEVINATSATWPHTVSGTDRLLVVGVVTEISRTVTITWKGAQTFTSIASLGSSGNQYAYLHYLVNPALGTGNIVVTLNSSDNLKAGAVSLINANQTTPIGTPQTQIITSGVSITTPSITSSSTEKIVDVIAISSSAVGATAAIPQQQIWSTVGGSTNPSGAGSYRDGGSSVTTSWSWTGSSRASLIAVPIKVAP